MRNVEYHGDNIVSKIVPRVSFLLPLEAGNEVAYPLHCSEREMTIRALGCSCDCLRVI